MEGKKESLTERIISDIREEDLKETRSFSIPNNVFETFKEKCKKEELKMSDVISRFMVEFCK